STTEKMAVFAPIATASVRIATREKEGADRSARSAMRTSWRRDERNTDGLRVGVDRARPVRRGGAMLPTMPRAARFVASPVPSVPPAETLRALRPALALHDPPRGRRALQVVVEPLEDAPVVVPLLRLVREPVVGARVHEEHHLLPGPARVVVELQPLPEVDDAVGVAVHDEHGRLEIGDAVCGRALEMALEI